MTVWQFIGEQINTPWTPRRNCWVWAAEIQMRFFGRALPMVRMPRTPEARAAALDAHPERQRWVRVKGPRHGAMVLMSMREQNRLDEHVGVCLLGPHPMITHVDEPHGVALEDAFVIRQRGWFPNYYEPI